MMIDYNVLRFDISVHDSFAVTEVKSFEQLEKVESDLHIFHIRNQRPEVNIV